MHCISLAILRRLRRFPALAVGTNRPFCVDVPLNINQSTFEGKCSWKRLTRSNPINCLKWVNEPVGVNRNGHNFWISRHGIFSLLIVNLWLAYVSVIKFINLLSVISICTLTKLFDKSVFFLFDCHQFHRFFRSAWLPISTTICRFGKLGCCILLDIWTVSRIITSAVENKQDTITCWWCRCVPARRCAWPWRRPGFEADDEGSRWQCRTYRSVRKCRTNFESCGPSADHWRLMLLTHWSMPLYTVESTMLQRHPRCQRWYHPEVAFCYTCCCMPSGDEHISLQLYVTHSTGYHGYLYGSGSRITTRSQRWRSDVFVVCVRHISPTYACQLRLLPSCAPLVMATISSHR